MSYNILYYPILYNITLQTHRLSRKCKESISREFAISFPFGETTKHKLRRCNY